MQRLACAGRRKKAAATDSSDDDMPADMYEVDFIVSTRLEKGERQYLIRWKGLTEKDEGLHLGVHVPVLACM